jgi:ribosomal protein S18 acetylase RimI-like enzyme
VTDGRTHPVERAKSGDIPEMAQLHAAALPDDLLPRLGEGFLARTVYPLALAMPTCTVWVSRAERGLTGVAIFTTDAPAFTRALTSNRVRPAVAALGAVLRRPSIASALWAHVRGTQTIWSDVGFRDREHAELYVIATHPEARGTGVGTSILRAGLDALPGDCLVRTSAPRARDFYLKHGFAEVGSERRGSREFSVLGYIK